MDEIREKIQHLWCQHCKALQKSNETLVVDCWYKPLDVEGNYAFCAANEDAIDEIFNKLKEAGWIDPKDCIMPGELGTPKATKILREFGYIKHPILMVTNSGEQLLSVNITRKELLALPMKIRRRILKEQSEILAQFDSQTEEE